MHPNELTAAVTAAAAMLAEGLNGRELSLLAAVLTQLGDTLITIAAQRAFCEAKDENTK